MAEGITFSRRVFLSILGFASVFAGRVGGGPAEAAAPVPAPDNGVVVVRGWVLRRDELHLLPPQ